MKIAIVGKTSYIATQLCRYLSQKKDVEKVVQISARQFDPSELRADCFDSVVFASGIVKLKQGETPQLFYQVNRDFAVQVAQSAKNANVKQFVYLSSMAVYGAKFGRVHVDAPHKSQKDYGRSKAQAEVELRKLETEDFRIALVRPPMVYGKGAKGNYFRILSASEKLPIFPRFQNKISMIYIENLCEFLYQTIARGMSGALCPQNNDYVCVSDMVQKYNASIGKPKHMVSVFNLGIRLMRHFGIFRKVFGDLYYDLQDSNYGFDYQVCGYEESICRSFLPAQNVQENASK